MPKNTEAWGKDEAKSRYGSGHKNVKSGDGMGAPTGECYPQKLGDKDNLQGPGYNNDTLNNWLRGNGNKPNFDKGRG